MSRSLPSEGEVTCEEAAKLLGVSRALVLQQVQKGGLAPVRYRKAPRGPSPVFKREEVLAFKAKRAERAREGGAHSNRPDAASKTRVTLRLYDLFRRGASIEACMKATHLSDAEIRRHYRAFLTPLGEEPFTPIDPRATAAEHDSVTADLSAENLARRKADEQRHREAMRKIRGG